MMFNKFQLNIIIDNPINSFVEWIVFKLLFFFQLWCEACSFSKMFSHEKQHFCVLFDHIVIFLDFFELKKTRNVIWRRMVHTRARELPYLTIW